MGKDPEPDPFSTLIGKALVDTDFRDKLLDQSKQKQALQEVGIEDPSDDQIDALRKAIAALRNLDGEFQKGIGAG